MEGTIDLLLENKDLFDYKKLGEVEEVWFKSSFDKRQIQGWIIKPLILMILKNIL